MPFKEYAEWAQPLMALPVNGKEYTVPAVGIQAALKLLGVIDGDDESMNGEPASVLWKLALGAAWDEMLADDVPNEVMERAGAAAIADVRNGRAIAEAVWSGSLPEAPAAPAANGQETPPATPTDEASTTRSPASGTTTRAKKASASKGRRSPGPTSSGSGP